MTQYLLALYRDYAVPTSPEVAELSFQHGLFMYQYGRDDRRPGHGMAVVGGQEPRR